MNCSTSRQQASIYLDRQLEAAANQEFFYHINSCTDCFEYVDELRQTSQLLQQLGPATAPKSLQADIINNLKTARSSEPVSRNFLGWLRNFILYKPQSISYATGFVVTCLLFVGLLYGFDPQFRFHRQIEDQLVNVLNPTNEIIPVNETLPSVRPSSAIVELTVQAYQQTPSKDLFVVADVSTEGRAQLVQLVDAPENPQLERHVAAVLKRASFKPATRYGRPIHSRMLLLIQTIDVRG
ncbi:MAG: hypothetical protein AB1489_06555 [Acidobacteriota bacterium]